MKRKKIEYVWFDVVINCLLMKEQQQKDTILKYFIWSDTTKYMWTKKNVFPYVPYFILQFVVCDSKWIWLQIWFAWIKMDQVYFGSSQSFRNFTEWKSFTFKSIFNFRYDIRIVWYENHWRRNMIYIQVTVLPF